MSDDIERLERARDRLRTDLKDTDLTVTERDAVNSALGAIALTLQSLKEDTD